MAQDSFPARLHLLIVATNPKGLQTAQRYLERRDVICSVVRNVKDAISYISKHRPSYVLLSWNLEGVSPVKIRQVISQSFNVKVILFAERGDLSTSSQLNSSGVPHVLHMPINGPKILIKLQNMIREEQELKDNPERDKERVRPGGASFTEGSESGAIHLSGNSKSNDTIVMKGSAVAKDGTFNGTASISSSGTRLESGIGHDSTGINSNFPSHGVGQGRSESVGISDESEESGRHWDPAAPESESADPGLRLELNAEVRREAVFLPQVDTVLKGSRSGSVLADGVKVVVKDVSRRTTKDAKLLESTRQISVLTVNSPRFQGYLVAAHGPNKKVDQEFTQALKKRLIEHLNKQGEKMEGAEADFEMEIQKVEFGSWAEEFADFVALSHHNDSEIAVAFVGGANSLAEVHESAVRDMMSCRLEDFFVGEAVPCDIFLRLEKNNKYLRYVKQGVAMTQEQKERLLQKQVKDLHFNKSDLMKYKEYVGKSFIRERLGESRVFLKSGPGNEKSA